MMALTWDMVPGLLLTSFFPGFFLAKVIFPKDRIRDPLTAIKILVLSVCLSIAITSVVGVLLGFLPHGTTGFFAPIFVGLALVAVSGGLLVWGWKRGAYGHVSRPVEESADDFAIST
jgi:uncharacterized membrane protein